MNCPICNSDNRNVAKYCKTCGKELPNAQPDITSTLVGMDKIKGEIAAIVATYRSIKMRESASSPKIRLNLNTIIIGNTGTGKSKLAEALQQIFLSEKIVTLPKMKIVDAVDFDHFMEEWEENIKKLNGGILLIENAQKLLPDGYASEICALDKLFNEMKKWDNNPIVFLSGLTQGCRNFFQSNPDIRNRFKYEFSLTDYSHLELAEICKRTLEGTYGLIVSKEAEEKLQNVFKLDIKNKDEKFGNAHLAISKAEVIFTEQLERTLNNPQDKTVLTDDIKFDAFVVKTTAQITKELDKFVGLDNIKNEISSQIASIEIEKRRSGKLPQLTNHYIFTGNPGTGKTTIARIMGDLFSTLGLLPLGHVIECDRSHLVSQYTGETAIKTNAVIDSAMGGVLFIDEAYSLVNGEDDKLGKEAIQILLSRLENDRGKFIAIVAGYSKEMHDFIDSNPGLKTRFNKTMVFNDYKPKELVQIFKGLVGKNNLELNQQADEQILGFFEKMYNMRDNNFGNAREARNAFDSAKSRMSERLQKLTGAQDFNNKLLEVMTLEDITGENAQTAKSLDQIMDELNELVGMNNIKAEIRKIAKQIEFNQIRLERGLASADSIGLHIVLTGNPGTGKTTIANKLGDIFKAIGLLPTNKVIEADRSSLISSYVGETPKLVNKLCDRAMGGILFIDEAYSLAPVSDSGGKDEYANQAIETLLIRMVKDMGKFVVIAAGYTTEMEFFLRANPGLESRFTHKLEIQDYTADELFQIFSSLAKKKNYILPERSAQKTQKAIEFMLQSKTKNFGNAREIRKLFDATCQKMSVRLCNANIDQLNDADLNTILSDDVPYEEPKQLDVEVILEELNGLVGLDNVKQEIRKLIAYLNIERERSLQTGEKFQGLGEHFVFTGNPGTGKTTVARMMSKVFHSMGVLGRDHLVECDRSDLVGGYVGQTAIKANNTIDKAMGGILFIDEAYNLVQGGGGNDTFGMEAVDTLLVRLENDRGKFICITAGYQGPMKKFLNSNPGLISRFTRFLHFDDYNGEQMAHIFRQLVKKKGLRLDETADANLTPFFDDIYTNRGDNFANAREVRNVFQASLQRQGNRLMSQLNHPDFNREEFMWLRGEDIF